MKRIAALFAAAVMALTVCASAAGAESPSRISPSLEPVLSAMGEGEKLTVAVWTEPAGDFKSSLELVEYVDLMTYRECGLTGGMCHTLEQADTYSKVYNRILYDLEHADIKAVIEKLALTDEDIIDSGCNMLIVRLTKGQIDAAAGYDEVNLIEPWSDDEPKDDSGYQSEPWPYEPLDPYDPAFEIVVSGKRGDADRDGEITIIDATLIQRSLAELEDDTCGVIGKYGDVNGDGLDILDATAIQRSLAGLDTSEDVGGLFTESI